MLRANSLPNWPDPAACVTAGLSTWRRHYTRSFGMNGHGRIGWINRSTAAGFSNLAKPVVGGDHHRDHAGLAKRQVELHPGFAAPSRRLSSIGSPERMRPWDKSARSRRRKRSCPRESNSLLRTLINDGLNLDQRSGARQQPSCPFAPPSAPRTRNRLPAKALVSRK